MLTYQLRPRTLRIKGTKPPVFPADVVIHFFFQPLQAFGDSNTGGRTLIQHSANASVLINGNTGQHTSDTGGALKPLEVRTSSGSLDLTGRKLTIRQHCRDSAELSSLIDVRCLVLPSLLAIEFADPPYVERVEGTIGDVPFGWELATMGGALLVTTQESLEKAFAQALEDIAVVAEPHRRRLLAALGYFHVGCRLLREAKTAGEFMSEAILNFSKVVEVLYGTKADDIRSALKLLGYTREVIQRDILPILDMRNSLDVGHPGLSLLTIDQLATIHWFADRTEQVITELLRRLLAAVRSGTVDVRPRTAGPPDATTLKVLKNLERIRADTSEA